MRSAARLTGTIAIGATLLLGAPLQSAQQAPPAIAFGVVQGVVVKAGTTEPLPDAKITVELTSDQLRGLRDAAARGGAGIPAEILQALQGVRPGSPPPPLSAVADSGGHFSINVPEGVVTVRAQLDGYFGLAQNGTSPPTVTTIATVVARQATSVRLEMIPGGTISGRVTDMSGKTLVEAIVAVAQRTYRNGLPALDVLDGKPTDDRGNYRLYRLPPGEYVVVVLQKRDASVAGQRAAAATEASVATFYPGAIDLSDPQPIPLKGGDDLTGLDIQVRTSPTFAVSGRVTSLLPPGTEATNRPATPVLTVLPHEGTGLPDVNLGTITANPDGTFEVRGLVPGTYDLIARLPTTTGWGPQNAPDRAQSPWAFGRVSVDVAAANIENVNIAVHQGVDVKGKVTLDGKGMPAAVRVTLLPDDNSSLYTNFFQLISTWAPFLDTDGSFTLPLIPEARYRVRVGLTTGPTRAPSPNAQGQLPPTPVPIAANAYVADVMQSGRSVYDTGFTVGTEAIAPIEIVIRSDGGAGEGTVSSVDGKPAPNTTVVLVPEASRRRNSALYKVATSDDRGRFSIPRVPPGTFKAFAWYDVAPGAYENAPFLDRYEARGVIVKAVAGSGVRVELTAIR